MKIYRYCIFDFDGTLIDSLHKIIEKFNDLSEEFGFQKITSQEIDELRDYTSKELVKRLNIPLYKLLFVIRRVRKALSNEMSELAPFAGIYEVLHQLYEANVYLGIVTTNSEENVKMWLKYHKMDHFFKFVYSASNLFGKDLILKRVIKKYKINKEQAYYIGDETRDIEAAKKSDIHSIAVTWGVNSEKMLLQANPDYFAKEPEDILKIGLEKRGKSE